MNSNQVFVDIWESNSDKQFSILDEGLAEGGVVDGKYILARVQGPSFFPETTSRNKVFYSSAAWESALNNTEFQRRLGSRLVFGTIGHDPDLSDNDIREGKFSHIVTKVWVDENNVGMAEYLILNTPPGQILNTLLRAKSRLSVSTRSEGYFESTSKSGVKTVVSDGFRLERIDFVIDPGYLEALPKLLESLTTNSEIKDINMSDAVIKLLESRVDELKSEKTAIAESLSKDQQELRTMRESLASIEATLSAYKSLGTLPAISEAYSELAQYHTIGTVQEISEALDQGEEVIDDLSNTVQTIQGQIGEDDDEEGAVDSSAYQDLGSPEDVKDALDQALEIAAELQKYRDLGSVEEIQQVLDRANEMTEELESKQKSEICAKYGCTAESLDALVSKGFSITEAEDFLANLKAPAEVPAVDTAVESDDSDKDDVADNMEGSTEPVEPEDDAAAEDEKEPISESMSTQMLRRMNSYKPKQVVAESKLAAAPKTSLAARLMSRSK